MENKTMINKSIILGISSGIAAYKIKELAIELKSEGHALVIMMTAHAMKMVSPQEFEAISPVAKDLFPEGFSYQEILETRSVEHISLADKAHLICIAPATANILAKLCAGIADDLLTTTVLATKAPILLCPSMNVNMWNNSITQENILELKKRGFHILEPATGALACGYEGTGRLPAIEVIHKKIQKILHQKYSLKNKTIMVTAGGTEVPIDSVRVITNHSSGRMGLAIAKECWLRGARVILVRANTNCEPDFPVIDIVAKTPTAMLEKIHEYLNESQVLIHSAAISDFTLDSSLGTKISSADQLTLNLVPGIKIINTIKEANPNILLVGFKAVCNVSHEELVSKSRKIIQEARADFVFANDVGTHQVFGSETNEGYLVSSSEIIRVEKSLKSDCAKRVVDYLESCFK